MKISQEPQFLSTSIGKEASNILNFICCSVCDKVWNVGEEAFPPMEVERSCSLIKLHSKKHFLFRAEPMKMNSKFQLSSYAN